LLLNQWLAKVVLLVASGSIGPLHNCISLAAQSMAGEGCFIGRLRLHWPAP